MRWYCFEDVCLVIYRPKLTNNTYFPLIFTAFPSAPILSADEDFLFLAGASASVLCVSTVDGSNVWSFVTGGLHTAEPVLSEVDGEDPVLYTIEVRNMILGRERVPLTFISHIRSYPQLKRTDLDWLDPSI
jgi:hypothetical protein